MSGFIGPVYRLVNNGVSISTAISALQLKTGVNGPAEIMRHGMSQSSSTTSTQIKGGLIRKSAAATVTAGVAGTTLLKNNPIAPTSDASLGTSATGITATVEGTNSDLTDVRGFNILNGLEILYTPEERKLIPVSSFCSETFMTAPPSATWDSFIEFRELRGS
jgi:hypothetical protein